MDVKDAVRGMLSDGAVLVGYVLAVLFLDPESGDQRRLTSVDMDAPVSTTIGLLEMAKLEIIQRSEEDQ